jgi:hypothetical protein
LVEWVDATVKNVASETDGKAPSGVARFNEEEQGGGAGAPLGPELVETSCVGAPPTSLACGPVSPWLLEDEELSCGSSAGACCTGTVGKVGLLGKKIEPRGSSSSSSSAASNDQLMIG